MKCPDCETDNPKQAGFCLNCGARLTLTCPHCQAELPRQANFCFACGSPVATPRPDDARHAGALAAQALRRLVPQEFAERLLAGQGRIERERRIVTILFSDVKGSTQMAEGLDPEDLMEIMDGAFDILIEPINRHEGTLARLMGDAILAFFGAPIAHEDDPERAIRAGLGIVAGARAYAARLERERGISGFSVRVGINTGRVVVGEVGSDLRVEYTAMGDAINVAARMEQHAPPGSILISHSTYRHVRGVFDVHAQEPLWVKGKREPIQTYLVQRARPRAFRRGMRGMEGVETRMIGREAELRQLQDAMLTVVEDGERRMVTIAGEAGVGKSRLLYEFENWVDLLPDRLYAFKGRASQEMANLPYALIRDLFAFRFQIQDSDPAGLVRQKLVHGISEGLQLTHVGALSQLEMKAHLIGQLLGFDFSDSPHVQAVLDDARQLRDRALIYVPDYFRAMTTRLPVCMFLEDIHWADHSSLDLLNHLALTMTDGPLLVVCLARPSLYRRRPHWGAGQAFHTRLELHPLSKRDSRRLVEEILQKAEQVPGDVRDLVVSGAEGNPFYVEELIKILIEDGVIHTEADRWQIDSGRLTAIRVPPTLTGVLQARLDRLPLAERAVLQQASVVGRRFWASAVVHIHTSAARGVGESTVLNALSALHGREMVFRRQVSTFAGTHEYTFKHALLRTVTYRSLLRRLRRVYHALVAEWLIERSGKRTGEHIGLIADHLEAAGQTEEAITYLRRAGEQAARQFANEAAEAYFGRALDLVPESDITQRYDLLIGRERVYDLQGAREAQKQDLERLRELAESLDDDRRRAEVALRQAHCAESTGDYPAAIAAAQTAIRSAQAAQDVTREAAGYLRWGLALRRQGEYEAAWKRLEQSLRLARAAQLHQIEADGLRALGNIPYRRGDYAQARSCFEQARAIYSKIGDRRAESETLSDLALVQGALGNHTAGLAHLENAYRIQCEMGDRPGQAKALNRLGNRSAELGRLAEARTYYEQALRIHQEVGDRRGEGIVLNNLAYLLWDHGDYDGALANLQQSLLICQQIGDHLGEGHVLGNLSYLAHLQGEDEAALDYGQQALAIAEEVGDRPTLADTWNTLGHAHTALGHPSEAEKLYRQALALRRELNLDHLAVDTLAGLGRLYLSQGNLARAQAQVEEILGYLDQGHTLDGTAEPSRTYLTCYRILRAGDDPRAEALLASAHHQLQEQAATIRDPELRCSFLENVAAHRGIVDAFAELELTEPSDADALQDGTSD
jgi:class 3 adenylate cyclase/tetratricopeptide (TPR) repeat protein